MKKVGSRALPVTYEQEVSEDGWPTKKEKNTHRKNLLVNTTLGWVSLNLGPRPYAERVLAETLEIERKYQENNNNIIIFKKRYKEKRKEKKTNNNSIMILAWAEALTYR